MAERFLLDNGMRVLVEYMPHLHSAATGVWVDSGSAQEKAGSFGVAHLLEHMMFKGTERRSSQDISAAMDNVGGVLNAFTSREQTCYYTRCLDEQFDLSMDLLSDMYHNSLFDSAELEREKQVVIEEINMYEDSPDDLVMDLFSRTMWQQHPYGRSVSGSVEDVAGLDRSHVVDYWQSHYHAGETVLTVAGSIAPEQVLEAANRYFAPVKKAAHAPVEKPVSVADAAFIEKDIEQTHVCLGFPGVAVTDPDYYAAAIVNAAFGGSASARLFQEVREKRGLSYSAYSYLDTYRAHGMFQAYASTQPSRCEELISVLASEFRRLLEGGLTEEEITVCREQLKGSLLLGMENTGNVMSRLGRHELAFGRVHSIEETVAAINAVTDADIRRVLDRLITPGAQVLAQVGPSAGKFDLKGMF